MVLKFFSRDTTLTLRGDEIKRHEDALYALEAKERTARRIGELQGELKSLLEQTEPFARGRKLASIRRVTPERDHYGYWVLAHEPYLASCGSAMEKSRITSGFASSYGGHHNGGGAWLGDTTHRVREVLTAWAHLPQGESLERFNADLSRLERGDVDTVYFDHPRMPLVYSLYRMNPKLMGLIRRLVDMGHPAGSWSETPLHGDKEAGYQYNRPVLLGDVIVTDQHAIEYLVPESLEQRYRILT